MHVSKGPPKVRLDNRMALMTEDQAAGNKKQENNYV